VNKIRAWMRTYVVLCEHTGFIAVAKREPDAYRHIVPKPSTLNLQPMHIGTLFLHLFPAEKWASMGAKNPPAPRPHRQQWLSPQTQGLAPEPRTEGRGEVKKEELFGRGARGKWNCKMRMRGVERHRGLDWSVDFRRRRSLSDAFSVLA
jgi:hypothetical protein